jgi:hypothetical protein
MHLFRPRPIALALAAGLVACGSAHNPDPSAASPPVLVHVPAKDSFSGRVVQGSGRFARDRGNVKVLLQPGAGVSVRRVTVTMTGVVAGALTGKLTQRAGLPDVGRTFAVTGSGDVKPLGHVTAAGTVTGVGNARFGYETLRLTLHAAGGSVVISATSGQVPAFSSP